MVLGTNGPVMIKRGIAPIHPGEIFLEEFLKPMGISRYRLAKDIHVDSRRINEIVPGKRAITADTALRLSRYPGTSQQFWLNDQGVDDMMKVHTLRKGCLGRGLG